MKLVTVNDAEVKINTLAKSEETDNEDSRTLRLPKMAEGIKQLQLPTNLEDALEAIAIQDRQREALVKELETKEQQLAIAAPKVALYDKAMFYGETTSLAEAAKILGMPPTGFTTFLRSFGWLYKSGNRNVPRQDKANQGLMILKTTEKGVSARLTLKGIEVVSAKIASFKSQCPDKYELLFG